jgi:hypothetical protein
MVGIKNPKHVQIICFNDPFFPVEVLKIDGTDWGQEEEGKDNQ